MRNDQYLRDINKGVFFSSFTGRNMCYSDPCQNGGECLGQPDSYRCNCTQGYAGPNCGVGKFLRHCLLLIVLQTFTIICHQDVMVQNTLHCWRPIFT